jgi:hypothetical protein
MAHQLIFLAVIWLAFVGGVGTVAAAGAGPRAVGAVSTGGVFLAIIGSLLVFLA